MAYVLGFFAADGYITVNRRGGQFWSIQIVDKKLLEQIRRVVGSQHKITKRTKVVNDKVAYRLQIGSIEMCDDLRKLGYNERKTKSLAVPHVPEKYLPDFIRGYFDGDGNVWVGYMNKSRNHFTFSIMTTFTSCSTLFLTKLKEKFFDLGLVGGCIYKSKRNYSRLQYSISNSLKLYDIMYNRLGTSELFLKRKKDVFEKYVKMRL